MKELNSSFSIQRQTSGSWPEIRIGVEICGLIQRFSAIDAIIWQSEAGWAQDILDTSWNAKENYFTSINHLSKVHIYKYSIIESRLVKYRTLLSIK